MPNIDKINSNKFTLSVLGDTAMILNFGDKIDETLNSKVLHVFYKIKKNAPFFIKDIVPTYNSIIIFYDLLIMENKKPFNRKVLENFIEEIKKVADEDVETIGFDRKIKIPVCYAEKYAPDIKEIAIKKKLSIDEIVRIHTQKKYRVYMIGFLPGFAYMGEVDEEISVSRKENPRKNVEAGSVGIAGSQTGIYPFDSPGGWQIIGQTPLKIFDKEKEEPVLLQPGDEIEFYSITEDEFRNY